MNIYINKKIICLWLAMLAGPLVLWAQQQNTLYFMNDVAQQSYLNPAFRPEYKVTIGLPGISSIYTSMANSGFAYGDFINRRASDDSLVMDINRLSQRLAGRNYLSNHNAVDALFIGFDLGPKWYLSLNTSMKSMTSLMYPSDLINLLKDGNAQSIGNELQFSPSFDGMVYREIGFGLAHIINDFMSVGARFKFLNGAANATSDRSEFSLQTAEDFALTLNGDIMLKSAGVARFDDDFEINGFSDVMGLFGNRGFAVDLGFTYEPINDLKLAFSVLDLGFINWTTNLQGFGLVNGSASYTFRGFDIAKLIEDEDAAQAEFDALEEAFEFDEIAISSYRTMMPMRLLASGEYSIVPGLRAGALLSAEIFRSRFNGSASANVTKDFGKAMSLSLSWSAMHRRFNNFGMGMNFNLAPFQLYLAADNALGAPVSLLRNGNINGFINNSQVINFRAGVNLIFGHRKDQEKLALPTY
ncbi:MAG: hypothetical protein JJU28_12625 [Cyclobacteriaceae bacterium]|nr:hypothetical protein [Cyclobacteriaceae bacterium]